MDFLSFPDMRYEVFETIYDGNLKVVARGRKIGNNTGDTGFMEPTGLEVETSFIYIFEFTGFFFR
jgi:predicted ester cyclase